MSAEIEEWYPTADDWKIAIASDDASMMSRCVDAVVDCLTYGPEYIRLAEHCLEKGGPFAALPLASILEAELPADDLPRTAWIMVAQELIKIVSEDD